MARLIDADVYAERIRNIMACWKISTCLSSVEANKSIDNLRVALKELDDIPTAYDVEKVVEEINNIDLQHPCDDCPHLQECDRIQVEVPNANDLCSLVTKHYAIEAVRKGGVE